MSFAHFLLYFYLYMYLKAFIYLAITTLQGQYIPGETEITESWAGVAVMAVRPLK